MAQPSDPFNSTEQLVGLNIFRAFAVFLMIIAHSSRVQVNLASFLNGSQSPSFLESLLLFNLEIEPIISAMFLFIAGFSLTLSLQKKFALDSQWRALWIKAISIKAAILYFISILFFIGEKGIQFPEIVVSSGILSIIALGIVTTALSLITSKPAITLGANIFLTLGLTYGLEANHITIAGLNAGPGGAFPLISFCFFGAFIGLIANRHKKHGLFLAVLVTFLIGVLLSAIDYPWTFYYKSQFSYFSRDIVLNSVYSIADLLGLKSFIATSFGLPEARSFLATASYWNHSSIFPLRTLGILTLMLTGFIFLFRTANSPLTKFGNYLGQHALTLYVYHLLFLSLIEISQIKPTEGWQTWLLILIILIVGGPVIHLRTKLTFLR